MKKLAFLSALALGTLMFFSATQLRSDSSGTSPVDTAFVDGGRITIELSAGEHRIIESADNHIRVSWKVGEERQSSKVDARTKVDGSQATITLDGPRNKFHSVIEVPLHSDLTVRLSAGELSVEKVTGDKDIRLRAGDLSIEVGDAKDYAHVEGSLWAGDISAKPFKIDASGLFRSIEWQGEGKHTLRFHLYAGDVRLY
jgi:hypothetical protein